jgi:hypothetical protein
MYILLTPNNIVCGFTHDKDGFNIEIVDHDVSVGAYAITQIKSNFKNHIFHTNRTKANASTL